MPPIQATTARCTNLCLAVSLGLSVCISWALLTAAVVTVESIYYTSAARPVVYQMHYVFDLSVCVRAYVHAWADAFSNRLTFD